MGQDELRWRLVPSRGSNVQSQRDASTHSGPLTPRCAPRAITQSCRPAPPATAQSGGTCRNIGPSSRRSWATREIDDCFCPLFWGDCEELGEPNEARDHTAALVAEARGDETGMQAIGGDPSTKQPVGEFARKECCKASSGHRLSWVQNHWPIADRRNPHPLDDALTCGARTAIQLT